jgi:nucleolin
MAVQFHLRREPRPDMNRKAQANPPSKCLFIGNMSFQMSDKDLNELFRNITNVLDVRVAVDRRSGQPRGFCHADFIDVPSAQAAKEILAKKEIYGRQLRVDFSRSNSEDSRRPREEGSSRPRET